MSGQVGNIRGYLSQDQPAGPFTWNIRLNSSKLTELEVERMREVVRPWLVITKTETGEHTGQVVFALTAHTLGSLATGREKLDTFLKNRLSITVENLCPPNRKNKERTKRRETRNKKKS